MSALASVLQEAAVRLEQHSPSPQLDAEVLLAHVLDKPRSYLFAWPARVLEAEATDYFFGLVARRAEGEPVAYLTGEREFWSLSLRVSADVLIPRPDTELLVECASDLVTRTSARRLLDLGTGSGAVALSLANQHRTLNVSATDISTTALQVAERNRKALGLNNVTLIESDWFDRVDGSFDLIVSNPPYVASNDPHLTQGDVAREPRLALDGGVNGLDCIRCIAQGAVEHLHDGGWLLLEHGFDQGEAVRDVLKRAGYVDTATHRDLSGNERVTQARAAGYAE